MIALLYFLLSLLGFDVGGSSLEHRSTHAGDDVLLSRAHVQAGVARFECVRSDSGECHYLVLPRDCVATTSSDADAGGPCAGTPIARFALAQGESHQMAGLQHFRLCVAVDADPVEPACQSTPAGGRGGS